MPHVYKDLPGAGSVLSIEIGSTMTYRALSLSPGTSGEVVLVLVTVGA